MLCTRPIRIALIVVIGATSLIAAQSQSSTHESRVVPVSREIVLRSGQSFDAIAVDVTPKDVILEFSKYPGSRATIPKALIAPDSLFQIEKERIREDDPEAWRQLAALAQENGLHQEKMAALARVAKLDPERATEIEKEIAACREACSTERLGIAQSLLEAGELDLAKKHIHDVLENFRGCVAAEDAKKLSSRIENEAQAEKARAAAIRQQRQKTEQANDDLVNIAGLVERGDKATQEARTLLDKPVKAAGQFSAALGLYDQAWRKLENFEPHDADGQSLSSETTQELARLRLTVRDHLVDTHLDLGHVYLARGNRPAAYRHAGHAAGLDPNNPGVMSLRTAIETSSYGRRIHRG